MILQRYLVREITKPLVAVCTALIVVFASFTAAQYLAKVVAGIYPPNAVVPLTLLKSVIALDTLLPIALHLSVVIALGRLYTDSEMTALFACGVSPLRILKPILILSVLVAVVAGTLSLSVRPWAFEKAYELKNQAVADFDFNELEAGRFYETQLGHRVIFVEHVDRERNRMERVFIQEDFGDSLRVISAKEAYHHISDKHRGGELLCYGAHVYEISRDGGDLTTGQFQQLTLELEDHEVQTLGYKRKAASTIELARSSSPPDIAEYQGRLSTPISTLLLGLLGFPLSRAEARKGKYAKLALAVLVYTAYYYANVLAETWVELGVMQGIWWVHAIVAVALVTVIFRHEWASWMKRLLHGNRVESQA